MEPTYHLPPILSPVKGLRNIQPSNSFRCKEPGRTQLPPLKRVVTLTGIEKEKIATPRAEFDQQHSAKKKRKKKRNRRRSHDPRAAEPEFDESAPLSQSVPHATRFVHLSSSSPNVHQRYYSVVAKTEEFDPQTSIDFSHNHSDELQRENSSRVCEEPHLRHGAKIQSKARNVKERNPEQKNIHAERLDEENALPRIDFAQTTTNSLSTKENGPSLIQVLSSDQSNVLRDGKEEYMEGVGWTDKCFHHKRRGTRIVQSKKHPHSVHPLEFHPHPPSQFRTNPCKNQHAMISHPSLPANDSRLNCSSLSRNGHSQVRQVCMHRESIPSVTSEFQPHPPLQPRSFVSQIRQCNSLSEYSAVPLDGQTSSSAQVFRNTSTLSKSQSLVLMDVYSDRCPEPRTPSKNTGHHSYRNVGSSPVLSGFAPYISRDHLMQSQMCPPASPVSKENSYIKTSSTFYSNRVSPSTDTNQVLDDLQNTAFPDTGLQSYFPTIVRLPANYQWAIIDDFGAVTPLPSGTFWPATAKKDPQESSEKSSDSPELGSTSSFPPSSPNTSALHLPNIKETVVEELPKLQATPNTILEYSNTDAPPKREQRCLGVGSQEERPPERIFEKVPSPTRRAKGAIMNTNQSSCKSFTPTVLDPDIVFFKDSPRINQRSALSLTEVPRETISTPEQSKASPIPKGEKKQRNFKLPTGWYSHSKSLFKSPFKKEKKEPPQKSKLPPLLSIDEFSSLNISDDKNSRSPERIEEDPAKDKKKKSVYTLGEFLKLCDDDDEDADGIFN